MKKIKVISINFFLLILLVEMSSFIFIKFKNISTLPSYKMQNRNHYGDYNQHFGAWHINNSTFNHTKKCFDVNYFFNSYGARDIEREVITKNKNRVIVLGDSVVEGYGLNDKDRITNILEIKTGIQHLNFGTSGHFGTTQYFLNYKHLSSKFSHNKVFVFMTLTNDFEDDSYEIGKKTHKKRYRPYVKYDHEKKKFNLTYYDRDILNKKKNMDEIRNFLSNFTYSYHVLRYFYSTMKSTVITNGSSKNANNKPLNIKNYLYNYDDKIFEIIKYNLRNINYLAKKNNAKLYLIAIGHKREHNQFFLSKETPKIINSLKSFSKKNNIFFIDAFTSLNIIPNEVDNIFFRCDSHHNALGNKLIADYIYNEIYK